MIDRSEQVGRVARLCVRLDEKAESSQFGERRSLIRSPLFSFDVVGEEGEATGAHDLRIGLTQGAGGGIACVRQRRLARYGTLAIKGDESAPSEIDLATDLDLPARCTLESTGDLADRLDIGGHIFSGAPIAAGCCTHQESIAIEE